MGVVMLPLRLLMIFSFLGFSCTQETPSPIGHNNNTENDTESETDTESENDTESETFEGEDWNDCSTMCSMALDCNGLTSEVQIFGTTQQECEVQCSQMDWSMSRCTRTAMHCDEFFGCVSSSTEEDTCICPGVCSLSIDCGLTYDMDACSDICGDSLSAGDVYGAGMACWKTAVEESDCSIAEQCPQLY
jgi:hypothetical protein